MSVAGEQGLIFSYNLAKKSLLIQTEAQKLHYLTEGSP